MSVKAGDFYVNLGLIGADKTNSDLKKTTDSFKDLKESATEAKVAFLAVFAVLSKIVLESTGLAQTLKNLSTITGISTNTYQEVALAGKPYGVTTETSQRYLNTIQDAFTGMKAGEDPPPWLLATFAQLKKHGIKLNNSVDYYATHPEAFMQEQQSFARLPGLEKSESKYILQKQGVPDEMIAAMQNGAYANLERFAGQIPTEKEINDSAKFTEKKNEIEGKIYSWLDSAVGASLNMRRGKPESDSDIEKGLRRNHAANLPHTGGSWLDWGSNKHLAPASHPKYVEVVFTPHNHFHVIPEKLVSKTRDATRITYDQFVALTKSAIQDR